MKSNKHIYYITACDVQRVAKETLGRRLRQAEIQRVVEKLLDKIQWYEPVEQLIRAEESRSSSVQA